MFNKCDLLVVLLGSPLFQYTHFQRRSANIKAHEVGIYVAPPKRAGVVAHKALEPCPRENTHWLFCFFALGSCECACVL